MTHSALVKIYNPDSVPAYTRTQRAHCAGGISEECIHTLDGLTKCLCKDSEANDWENTVTVLKCNMLCESVWGRLFLFVLKEQVEQMVCVYLQEALLLN